MDLVSGVSLIAAFFGGMVALFAPCCITFLLPSYLANIFKNKEKVVWMTLIFGLGIATILVPTALGVRAIGNLFSQWHEETYLFGGAFMIALGLLNLVGKKFTLPMIHLTIDLTRHNNPWAVYTLGVFSGITSSCCTPVLVGILTLTFLSPTFLWAALAGFSYVAGMVAPLVILAIFLERVDWTKFGQIRAKTVNLTGKEILLTDAVAGVIFFSIGVLFIYLAATGQIIMGMSRSLEQSTGEWIMSLVRLIQNLPAGEYLFLAALAVGVIYLVKRKI